MRDLSVLLCACLRSFIQCVGVFKHRVFRHYLIPGLNGSIIWAEVRVLLKI